MYDRLLNDIRTAFLSLDETLPQISDEIRKIGDDRGRHFALTSLVDDLDYSYIDVENLGVFVRNCAQLFSTDLDPSPIPISWLSDFALKLNSCTSQTNTFITALRSIRDGGAITSLSENDYSLVDASGVSLDFRSNITGLLAELGFVLGSYYSIRGVVKSPKFREFTQLFTALKRRWGEIETFGSDLNSRADEYRSAAEAVVGIAQRVTETESEASRLLSEIEKDRRTLVEYLAEGATKIEGIRTTAANADKLKILIESHQNEIERSVALLSQRENDYERTKSELATITDALTVSKSRVEGLVIQAEGMLSGATTAGLAGTYSSRQATIGAEVRRAQFAFYVSIFLLIILTIPIGLYVIPKELIFALLPTDLPVEVGALIGKDITEHSTEQVLGQILARALLLIPGIWLVRFCGNRHDRLFRLREEYAYRYTIASSVEGFKQQAADYQQEIAAAAFFELTANPTDKMSSKSQDQRHPNPVMEWVMKKLEGRT